MGRSAKQKIGELNKCACWLLNQFLFSSLFGSQNTGTKTLSSRQETGKFFRVDQPKRKDLNVLKIPSSPIIWPSQITHRDGYRWLASHIYSELPVFGPSLLNINKQPRITRYLWKRFNMKERKQRRAPWRRKNYVR